MGNNSVYVKNFPGNMTEAELKNMFKEYGSISWGKMFTDPNQRKIAVPAARILYKICDLAAQGKVKQSIVGIQQRFYITVEC